MPGPGILAVSHDGAMNAAGTTGGAFYPSSLVHALTNSGGLSLDWTATASANWLTLTATSGTLAAANGSNVMASFNITADALPVGDYTAVIIFSNATSGAAVLSRTIALTVSPISMSVAPAPSGVFHVTINGYPGQAYVSEASTDLVQWTSIATNVAGQNGTLLYIDASASPMPHRFYRGRPHR